MDDDEFETECLALEAIFAESYNRETDRKVRISVEPTTSEGETLTGTTQLPPVDTRLLILDWTFSLKVEVPQSYPEEIPIFETETLENTMYASEAKKEIKACLEKEAEGMKGEPMIYNLVEWLRERLIEYVDRSKQHLHQATASSNPSTAPKMESKKEKMTKAQKRRFYSRFGAVDEKPRGWNWVDIVAHLSSRPQPPRN